MRKTIMFLMLVLGMVVLLYVPAFAGDDEANTEDFVDIKRVGRDYDILADKMSAGHDYTRTWYAGGYTAWVGTDNWGGWFWAVRYLAPCPQWLRVPDAYGGYCPEWTPGDPYQPDSVAQTQYGEDDEVHKDAYIVDDLYARVVDNWIGTYLTIFDKDGNETDVQTKGILDQDLDILFATYPSSPSGKRHILIGPDGEYNTVDLLIDQSIDQQLAYWEDVNSDNHIGGWDPILGTYMDTNENGITQRLVAEFGVRHVYTGTSDALIIDGTEYMTPELEHVDQWVAQWLRDIDAVYDADYDPGRAGSLGKEGIEQYYSSWFEWGKDVACPTGVCVHTYELNHSEPTHVVEKGVHNHNPLDDSTYKTETSGRVWDP